MVVGSTLLKIEALATDVIDTTYSTSPSGPLSMMIMRNSSPTTTTGQRRETASTASKPIAQTCAAAKPPDAC